MLYLIEDDQLKAERLGEFLREEFALAPVSHFRSYQSGLKALKQKVPTAVIMDMTLPNFDAKPDRREGRLLPLGGYELMRKMALFSIEVPVVVVTQFTSFNEENTLDNITKKCIVEFPSFFRGSVYFSQANSDWKDQLAVALRPILERTT